MAIYPRQRRAMGRPTAPAVTPPPLDFSGGTGPIRQPPGYGGLPKYDPLGGGGTARGASIYTGTGGYDLTGGAPGPTQDSGTAPVRQPIPGTMGTRPPLPDGLPATDAPPMPGGEMPPVRQPPGYGAFGTMPPPSQGGDHAQFIESLPDRQKNQLRQLMSSGMPFEQAYRMSMQRMEAY